MPMRRWPLLFVLFLILALTAGLLYGPPSAALGPWDRFEYAARLTWHNGLLTRPADPYGTEQEFIVDIGEPVYSIAARLQSTGLVRSSAAFQDYLIYKGLDTTIQAGRYTFSPAQSPVQIAHALQDATPAEVTFVVLAGWRVEEVAASLPTSGLGISPDEFLQAVRQPPPGYDFLAGAASVEGFLYPDAYQVPRLTGPDELVVLLVSAFARTLTPELRLGFERQGLTVYQAVTLASLVEREAVVAEEGPVIASVFLNRLAIGMKLDSDPTVQYALGYNPAQGRWWTNPLSRADLQFDSPYNTYLYSGLPPGPIANPGLGSLQAVAEPARSPYFFFRAACDGSGTHTFAVTYEEHLNNACP
jgi:UPF0755 protein